MFFAVYDSAGRYYGQFFFGHDYWLGSYSLCQELGNKESSGEEPPFPLKFYMTKLRVNINRELTPVVSIQFIFCTNITVSGWCNLIQTRLKCIGHLFLKLQN